MSQLFQFSCAGRRYALDLVKVERVIAAAAVSPIPGAPEIVAGVLNLHGEIVPVIDFRLRIDATPTRLSPDLYFIIANGSRRRLCLMVDQVDGLLDDVGHDLQLADISRSSLVRGVLALPDGLTMIFDLDEFLSLDEQTELDHALDGEA